MKSAKDWTRSKSLTVRIQNLNFRSRATKKIHGRSIIVYKMDSRVTPHVTFHQSRPKHLYSELKNYLIHFQDLEKQFPNQLCNFVQPIPDDQIRAIHYRQNKDFLYSLFSGSNYDQTQRSVNYRL